MADEESFGPEMTPLPKIDKHSNSLTRNSTGIMVSSNNTEKDVPRYLRASTGSCHDLCKYGHKSASEEKAKRPKPWRASMTPNDSQLLLETVASLGKKRSPSVPPNLKFSPNMRRSLDSLDLGETISRREGKKPPLVKSRVEVSSKPLKQRVSSCDVKLELSSKRFSSETRSSLLKSKSMTSKLVASLESSRGLNATSKRTMSSTVASTKVLPKPALNSSVGSLNAEQNGSSKVEECPNNDDVKKDEAIETESCEVEEKTLYVVKSESEGKTLDSDENKSCSQEVECVIKIEDASNASEFDEFEFPAQEVEHVVNVETENNASEPDKLEIRKAVVVVESSDNLFSDQDESEYSITESEDDTFSDNTEDSNNKVDKNRLIQSENEDEKSQKVKFRRGTIVEIQREDNAPRRLRFRRGRVLDGQDMGPDGRRRRFKRREGDNNGIGENGAERVVLKHQDVGGKRDAQGLLNNVIEEAASKLVETRKSKVKALVGAFETVISLQDGKAS